MTQAFYEQAARPEADPAALAAMARELLARLQARSEVRPEGAPLDGVALQLLYLRGSLHAYLSEFDQAVPYYREYLMVMPEDERVLTEYVQVLYLASDRQLTERVRVVAARALELNPHNQEVLALLALHEQLKGR